MTDRRRFPNRARKTVRPIRFEGDVAFIPLTRSYEAIIDAADAVLVSKWNWYANPERGATVYAIRTSRESGKRISLGLHRAVLQAPDDMLVDHRDGNGLNNRRSNLRICTRQQNAQAVRVGRRNKLGVRGVHLSRGRFSAMICVNGKSYGLGRYDTIEEAKGAYDRRAKELFGEFAAP